MQKLHYFSARIQKIGINPYVLVPPAILRQIFDEAGKDRGPVPVGLIIHKKQFPQTLVKYSGKWRLYLNTPMRQAAGKDVGDMIELGLAFDPLDRSISFHPRLAKALKANKEAMSVFGQLPPSRKKEIMRYINSLKTESSVDRNVERAIKFLTGEGRFIGRDHPL